MFFDIQQAFDKVWHEGLLYKIKQKIPQFYLIIKSYLTNRKFQVRYGQETSALNTIKSGVPQGSVLGPVLYTLYTADLSDERNVTLATYADDTAIMATHENPVRASQILQGAIRDIKKWFKSWKIKVSDSKSVHITFPLRKADCPTITLNNEPLPTRREVKYLGMHLDRRLGINT